MAETGSMLDALRVGLFSARCASCDSRLTAPTGLFCPTCEALVPSAGAACPRCGRPRDEQVDASRPCDRCLRRPPPWKELRSGGPFEGPLARAIRRLKYGGQPGLAPLLSERLPSVPVLEDALFVVVPVPLHPARLRRRGFNQAALLARGLAQRTNAPLVHEALVRTRPTPPQVRQPSASARRRNVEGAFAVRSEGRIRGRAVVLVDDVVTSGATVDACAKALRSAGANAVLVRAVAHG